MGRTIRKNGKEKGVRRQTGRKTDRKTHRGGFVKTDKVEVSAASPLFIFRW